MQLQVADASSTLYVDGRVGMRSERLIVMSLLFVLASSTVARAQWCDYKTIRDWTIDTRLGRFGFQETRTLCDGASSKTLEFGRMGEVRLNTLGCVAACLSAVPFVGLAAARFTAKSRPSGSSAS
jgi:hypothetical protein